ncbi:Rrf2 family transcriptional regulator [Candidatus Microgenomates bacterium]|nr:MAG: Rrf2 family transcriptional regulator [Candidatus Microgenomates bacterium]
MIRFSKKEDYAVILINKLVQNYSKRLIPLSEIAKEYKISVLFLRNLAGQLKKSGIIEAVEGKNGGYYLAKEPKDFKVGEVLSVFSKKPMLDCCPLESLKIKKIKCAKEDYCIPGFVWRKLNKSFLEKIYNLSLDEFVNYKE